MLAAPNIGDPAFLENPFPFYEIGRKLSPLFVENIGLWMAFNHDECQAILRDAATWQSGMGAAAEAVEPGLRAGVGVLETPFAGEPELGGAALHEPDEALGIAGYVVAHPEFAAAVLRFDREKEALRGRFVRRAFPGQRVVEVERAGGVLGCADVEQAREMGEIVGHDRLLKRESPARWPGSVEG